MAGSDTEFRERLLATFRGEAEEYIGFITGGLITLEKSGPDPDPGLVEQVYRKIHSLKGAARAVNMREIEQVCQNLESVFAAIKKGACAPGPGEYDIFHQAIRLILDLLGGDGAQGQSVGEIGAALRGILPPEIKPGYPETGSPAPYLREAAELPRFTPAPPAGRAPAPVPPVAVAAAPGGLQQPAGPGFHPEGDTVRIVSHKLDRLIAGSEDLLATRLFITHRMKELMKVMTRFSIWRWNQAFVSSDLHLIRETLSGTKRSDLPEDLVIPLKNIVGFLEYDREFITYLKYDLAEHIRETEQDRAALEASTSEISELIHDAVLLPVASVLDQFSSFIREYSRSLGKNVDYAIECKGIGMDRRILEALKDPLLHLINNSIDHGIEFPDLRVRQNKPPAGTIRIRVLPLTGSRVAIEVSDDGAGISGREIRDTAVRNGIITAEEARALGDEAATWLIFRSGFSTKPVVTDLSGRGLGLAIVEDTVTRLGGDLLLSTQYGKGTSITLRLPVRLATLRGVVVRSGRQVFVFPVQQVRHVMRVRHREILSKETQPAIDLKGEVIRLIRLTDALGIVHHPATTGRTDHMTVVVLAYGAGQIACVVDEVLQEQEIIVRTLGSQLRRVRKITGAVILGDGTIALVLDPLALIQETQRQELRPHPLRVAEDTRLHVLVVEDSVTSMMLLQTALETAGYRVTTATDGMDALALLRDGGFDVVVSDVDMPRMNGFLLTEKIRADPRFARTPVVLITSLDSDDDRRHGIASGADAYIVKSSFTREALLGIVGEMTRRRGRDHETGSHR